MKRGFNLRTFLLVVLGATTLAVCAASAAFTFTWFSNQENLGKRIQGETDGAYFARGTGTADDPYVINRPFHLYNLAWLQYTGYFGDQDCYFIIEKDLDMTGWTLPPIGTTEHPFIGHLDGNDSTHAQGQEHAAVVSNLTVSNEFSDYNRHPGAITSVSNVNIVGFFGVVGKIGQDYSSSASSIVPSVKNLYLNNVAVNDKTSNTLIGIAAGYVNGVVEGVGITGNSSLSVPNGGATAFGNYTKNVSDYTSVGYCEKAFRSSLFNKEITLQASTPVTGTKSESGSGSDTGWGGSIDMKSMYDHIKPLYENSTIYQYSSEENVSLSFDASGNAIPSRSAVSGANVDVPSRISWDDGDGYDSYNSENNGGNTTAQYSFVQRQSTSQFLYLSGRASYTVPSSLTQNITVPTSPNGTTPQTISDGNENYLALGKMGLINSTSSSKRNTAWYFENGALYTLDPYHNFAKIYLYDDNGTLSTSSTVQTTWHYSSNDSTLNSSKGNYLSYYQGRWLLSETKQITQTQYTIRYSSFYSSYYLSINSYGNPARASSSSSAAKFYTDSNGYFYTIINGNIAYLILDSPSSSNYRSSVSFSSDIDTAAFKKNGNNLVAEYGGTTWYLYQYGAYAYQYRYNYYHTSYTFTTNSILVTVNRTINLSSNTNYTVSNADATYTTQSTYYPLSFDATSTSKVSTKNTGYVVSGAYEDSGINADIRVSQYGIDDIEASTVSSYSSSVDPSKVYTINTSGSNTISDASAYQKFTDSLNSLNAVLSTSSYVYGLHFMNASISKNHLITVPYASINGKEYSQYELPEDAIDFQLRDKGYINFFAGTYFSGNDSFFSLHRVFRDNSNSIDDIKEISKIYHYTADMTAGKHYAYVYQYTDGTFSSPYWFRTIDGKSTKCKIGTRTPMTEDELSATTTSVPDGYTSYFDTAWIKKQQKDSLTNNAVYYFEVPVNEGEYALGSVDGGTGAYLMYLDIGANAQRTDRTTINEIKTTNTYEYSFPNGVSFVDSTTATVTPDESAGLTLSASTYSGTLSISRTDSTIAYTSASNTGISACFIGNSVTLTGNGTTVTTETYVSLVTETEKSQTILDYNTSTDEETKTVYKQDNNGNQTTQINDGEATDGWGDADVEFEPGADGWHTEAIVKNVYINGKTVTVTVDSTYAYNHDEEQNTYYYALTGYRVSVKGDVEVQVTATQIGNNIVVSLLTDPTNNTYVTLTVNVPQTIPASN